MTQDICGGGIGKVVCWQALRNFPRFFGFLLSVFFKTKAQYSLIRHFVYISHVVAV